MDIYTKLIFGLHVTEEVTLVVDGDKANPAAQLVVLTQGQPSPAVVSYDAGAHGWVVTLGAKDYLVSLEVSDDQWWDDDVSAHGANDDTLTFVVHGPEDANEEHHTDAWQATSAKGDPKDPWPPPESPLITLPTASLAWFDDKLHAARSAAMPSPRDFDPYALAQPQGDPAAA